MTRRIYFASISFLVGNQFLESQGLTWNYPAKNRLVENERSFKIILEMEIAIRASLARKHQRFRIESRWNGFHFCVSYLTVWWKHTLFLMHKSQNGNLWLYSANVSISRLYFIFKFMKWIQDICKFAWSVFWLKLSALHC